MRLRMSSGFTRTQRAMFGFRPGPVPDAGSDLPAGFKNYSTVCQLRFAKIVREICGLVTGAADYRAIATARKNGSSRTALPPALCSRCFWTTREGFGLVRRTLDCCDSTARRQDTRATGPTRRNKVYRAMTSAQSRKIISDEFT